jgi:UDP-N-acetylglucosamine--N-acetylmuramyl-(pentapeptide) pyrophosphoryl-undecaprenol N-acetylglucosamine transferase
LRVLVAGGGTGGHFFPALAVSEELLRRGNEVLYVGSFGGIEEREKFPAKKVLLKVSGFIGRGIRGYLESYRFVTSTFEVLKLIGEFKPDAAVVFGGYSSLPVGISSAIRGVPLFVQEQNSVPGRVNRLLSRFSERCFLGFPSASSYFSETAEFTGNPVRREVLEKRKLKREVLLGEFGLDRDKKVLVVIGGSQGALWINELVLKSIPLISKLPLQVVHITGRSKKEEELKEKYREFNVKALVFPFYRDVGKIYRLADAAVSRAGALAISEMSLFGVPSLLIPFPFAADNHQLKNAEYVEKIGGALCKTQGELNEKIFSEEVERLLFDRILRSKLRENFLKFSRPHATETVVERICSRKN